MFLNHRAQERVVDGVRLAVVVVPVEEDRVPPLPVAFRLFVQRRIDERLSKRSPQGLSSFKT